MEFFFPFGAVALALFVVVSLVLLIVTARRVTPDPTGRRPTAIYLLSVMFIAMFIAAAAVAQIGRTLAREVTGGGGAVWTVTAGTSFTRYERFPEEAPLEPLREAGTVSYGLAESPFLSELSRSVLVFGLATVTFEFHRRRWRELLGKETGDG
jgi:hypothetical protein